LTSVEVIDIPRLPVNNAHAPVAFCSSGETKGEHEEEIHGWINHTSTIMAGFA
jgi:hypothetical protein